ncbi:ThuA domain-containing protein [Sphingobium aquiterrae]|uniref:ThuA domain-containing protein n=1 Tax=Sphingobium aquiterrae TaxID=2038656 RepID=UPI00301B2F57
MTKTAFHWLPLAACLLFAPATSFAQQQPAQDQTQALLQKPHIPGQNVNGLHVYLRGGLKTHRQGQHDYPQFVADWSKILTEHGAVVDGSLHSPTAEELKDVDVIVMYKGDAGFMTSTEKAALDAFVKRGGGIVIIHDALCGPDPAQFADYVGGAKKHGEVNFTLGTSVPYKIVDPQHPIMKGMSDMTLFDESFYRMTWADDAKIHVLATATITDTPSSRRGGGVGQTVPQIWTYEHTPSGGKPARAFVWMQGHTYANLQNYQIENMLLRGIAWAGRHPVDELVSFQSEDLGPGAHEPAESYLPANGGSAGR